MKRILYIIILVLGALGSSFSQQIPHYSQYWLNDYVLNPAVAGTKNYIDAKSNNRYQWIGINDAPRTYILSLNGPILKEKMGVGGYIFTDIVGPTRRTGGYGSYAYNLNLTSDIKLSLGLSAGLLQFAVDASKISLRDEFDPALSNNLQSVMVPDASFGLLAYTSKWYFGATANQLLNNRVKFFDNPNFNNKSSRLALHFTSMAGYKYPLNESITIEPTLFIKYVAPVPVQVDISARGIYKEKVWAGLTYRTSDAIAITIGYLMGENLTFGYAYDYATSNIRNYSSGTHELMLGIRFNKRRTPPSVGPAPVITTPEN
jgi:type IX secretion system PorP/SprF family membrane protein